MKPVCRAHDDPKPQIGRKFLVLFSHSLTKSQRQEIDRRFKASILEMDSELAARWRGIPPECERLSEIIAPFIDWIRKNAAPGDYVLVQGDFGATFLLVDFCLKSGLNPVYATTTRVHSESHGAEGRVEIRKQFKHVSFRRYEPWPR